MVSDKNRLSIWYPKLSAAVPTPYTVILDISAFDLSPMLAGARPDNFYDLAGMIMDEAKKLVALPIFVRTDFTACKAGRCFRAGIRAMQQPKHVRGIPLF